MDLSVIIVCYKGWDKLNRCLESLDSFKGEKFSMEVIVVDNNSGDKALDKLQEKFRKFSFNRNSVNGGFANGCNFGAASSTGDNLLFLNPDTVAREAEVGKMLNAVRSNKDFFIVSCRQILKDGKDSNATGSFPGLLHQHTSQKPSSILMEKVDEVSKSALFPDWVSGSVMMIRKEVFIKLNGFDEDFWMYSEDVDICRRARNLGGEIVFFTDVTIDHDHGGSSRADPCTTSITKCEVQISKHLFVHKHKSGMERICMHSILIADNLITGFLTGIFGLIFFFVPLLFVRFLIFIRIMNYYLVSFSRKSWISNRSVNFNKTASGKLY
ncbi:MAG: glycosyltransferase [Bacteroidales bacterium]|jgi:hypothetical protein|nr:glycosyltransferase [Bacteroidales bacterium]